MVESNFMLRYRGLKDFIFLLNDRYSAEMGKAQILKSIHDSNYAVTTFESLFEGIVCFKGDMLNEHKYALEFCDNLKGDIIKPLQNLCDSLLERISKISQNYKKEEKIYKQNVIKLKEAKEAFHRAAENAELYKLKVEANKNDKSIDNSTRQKYELKSQEMLKNAKEKENNYLALISLTNDSQESYIESKKNALNSIQDLEEEMGENIKACLRKYTVFQVSYVRNLQYDTDRTAKLMESINIRKDIQKYIYKRSTQDIPPYKFDFVPYVSKFDSNDKMKIEQEITKANITNKINNDIVSNVKGFITNVFFNEAPKIGTSTISQTKIKVEIESIVQAIINNKDLPNEVKKTLTSYIFDKRNRRLLLNTINNYRLKGGLILTDKSYKILGDTFNEVLNALQMTDDFYCVSLLITLATSLYKNPTQENGNRIFLQDYLINHGIWSNQKFWTDIISFNINEEMHNQKSYNIGNKETFEEKCERVMKIVYGQITSFIYNMISFNVDVSLIKDVLCYFNESYSLSNEYQEQNNKIINDYIKKKEEMDKNKEKDEKKDKEDDKEQDDKNTSINTDSKNNK